MNESIRVLLAEDEETHSFPIERALAREGFDVTVVRDADRVRETGLGMDALVIDARLPSAALEGITAAADLIRNGLRSNVPIIFISVYPSTAENVQRAFENNSVLQHRYIWMQKWFEPRTLAKKVRSLLDQELKQ